MKITGPIWVKRANQWCITVIENIKGMFSKHDVRQTQYWFSTKDEAIIKIQELNKKDEPEGGKKN